MKLVSPEFDTCHQGKQNETGHSNGHPEDVDKRIDFLFFKIPQSD
jgi:hypothetical protein